MNVSERNCVAEERMDATLDQIRSVTVEGKKGAELETAIAEWERETGVAE
jgi:hypothetical protein